MEFKKGLCLVTKKKCDICLALPAGSIFANREALFSEEGVEELNQLFENSEEYFKEVCVINQKEYKRCAKVFNKIYLKRNAYISRKGINNLIDYMKNNKPVVQSDVVEQIVSEAPAPAPPADIPGKDEQMATLVSARESAEQKVYNCMEALDQCVVEDQKESLTILLNDAEQELEEARRLEVEYINSKG